MVNDDALIFVDCVAIQKKYINLHQHVCVTKIKPKNKMKYIETYQILKNNINYIANQITIPGFIEIRNFTFTSNNCSILPDDSTEDTLNGYDRRYETGIMHEMLYVHDSDVKDNISFRYHVFSPIGTEKAKEIVLMLHGFNEKYWYKYLPWAKHIVDATGKTVVLFPIAFHMNRAPHEWSDARLMYKVSNRRRELFPDIIHSSLSNAAISTRLHTKPQRFVWSGLQTYYDIIQFIDEYKSGLNPFIAPDAEIDIFAYSIGAFLAEILIMTNHNHYFEKSKLVMFCGGPVFNRLSPVSKFILDSQANVALYSYMIEHLDSHLKNDAKLKYYLCERPEGMSFRSMLNYGIMSDFREKRLNAIAHKLLAVTLKQDTVVPPYEVANTLQGKYRDIPVKVDIYDLSYPYIHEDPFPNLEKISNKVDTEFNRLFDPIGKFLSKN